MRYFRSPLVRVIVGVVVPFVFLFFLFGFHTISNGHIGVIKTWGKVSDELLSPGLTWQYPWKTVHEIPVLTVKIEEEADVPTSEGLTVTISSVLNYSLETSKVIDLYKEYGGKHVETFILPQFKSALRNCALKFKAEDLYTANRGQIESSIQTLLKNTLEKKGIIVEEVLLSDLSLPKVVKERIEAKIGAEQDVKRMEFLVQKEVQEAERKRVEAKGIADAQQIIKKDLDSNYLIYLWIQALEKTSGNSQTIYIPIGANGLPIFATPATK
jgi:regulator of protease activity HflC (stomatin/prohibitin superfamily)